MGTAPVHPNYIKSSNLFIIAASLGIINLFLHPFFLTSTEIAIGLFTIVFLIGVGMLIREGFTWMKYVCLVMFVLGGLLSIPTMIKTFTTTPAVGIINLIQTALQAWSLVLLFKIPAHYSDK